MCDTFIAMGRSTKGESTVIFGKNSDRPFSEKQPVVSLSRKRYSIDSTVRCTYITIPQVRETYAVLLSKPEWMWGAEMGANEMGVVIGNEAVWTKEPNRPASLLGMDMLRLALERCSTAEDALTVICELLEEYGQGGGCAEGDPYFTYHNSFLIADRSEAWVLETAGPWWVAERVIDGVRNISNGLSIRNKYDRAKPGIIEYAIDSGYCSDPSSFNFAKCFSAGGYSSTLSVLSREAYGKTLLTKSFGKITPKIMMEVLRDHKSGICMHGGFRTTASQVSLLSSCGDVHWFTGSPSPCVSVFKPFGVSSAAIDKTYDIWNLREIIGLKNLSKNINIFRSLERDLFLKVKNLSVEELQFVTDVAFKRENEILNKLL